MKQMKGEIMMNVFAIDHVYVKYLKARLSVFVLLF